MPAIDVYIRAREVRRNCCIEDCPTEWSRPVDLARFRLLWNEHILPLLVFANVLPAVEKNYVHMRTRLTHGYPLTDVRDDASDALFGGVVVVERA